MTTSDGLRANDASENNPGIEGKPVAEVSSPGLAASADNGCEELPGAVDGNLKAAGAGVNGHGLLAALLPQSLLPAEASAADTAPAGSREQSAGPASEGQSQSATATPANIPGTAPQDAAPSTTKQDPSQVAATPAATPAAIPPGAINYFWNYYDSQSMRSWILMGNKPNATGNLQFGLSIADSPMALGDLGAGAGVVPPGRTLYYTNPGVASGPVIASSLTNTPAITSQRSLLGSSFEEVPGVDLQKRSSHFYWTWYDMLSPGFKDWIIVSNPDPVNPVAYEIRIANTVIDSGTIGAGGMIAPTYPGRMGGPVEVITDRNVMATQRVLSNNGAAFNEMPGIPAEDLASDYLWTWYDMQSPGFMNWVLIANPHMLNEVLYEIRIAGATVATGSIPPKGMVTPTFPGTMNGPVEVIATGTGAGSGSVIATQRIITGPSFGEVTGYRRDALSNDYLWTWYDMTSGFMNWVLVANPDPLNAISYEIKIGGVTRDQGTIGPGSRVTPTFPGTMAGPVEVLSSGPSIVSQRVTFNGHFNEVPGTVMVVNQQQPFVQGACARR